MAAGVQLFIEGRTEIHYNVTMEIQIAFLMVCVPRINFL